MTNTRVQNSSVNVKLESVKLVLKYLPSFYLYESDVLQKYKENVDLNSEIKDNIKKEILSYDGFINSQTQYCYNEGFNINFDVINTENKNGFDFNFVRKAKAKEFLKPYVLNKSVIIQSNSSDNEIEFSIENLEKEFFNVDFHTIDFSKTRSLNIGKKNINMIDFKMSIVDVTFISLLHKGKLGHTSREVYKTIKGLSYLNRNVSNDDIENNSTSILRNDLDVKRITSLPLYTNNNKDSSIRFGFHTNAKFLLKDGLVTLKETSIAQNYSFKIPSTKEIISAIHFSSDKERKLFLKNIKKNRTTNKAVVWNITLQSIIEEILYSPSDAKISFVLKYDFFDRNENPKYASIPNHIFFESQYSTPGFQLLLEHPEIMLEGAEAKEEKELIETIIFNNAKIEQKNPSRNFVAWSRNNEETKISRYRKTITFSIEEITKALFIEHKKENYELSKSFSPVRDIIEYKIDTYYHHKPKDKREVKKEKFVYELNSVTDYSLKLEPIGANVFKALNDSGIPLSSAVDNLNVKYKKPTTPVPSLKALDKIDTRKQQKAALGNYETYLYISKNSKVRAAEDDSSSTQENAYTDLERKSFEEGGIAYRDYIKKSKEEIDKIGIIDSFAKLNLISSDHPGGKSNLEKNNDIAYFNKIDVFNRHRRGNVQPRLLSLIRLATIALRKKFPIVKKVFINSRSSMDIPTWVEIASIHASKASIDEKIKSIKAIIPDLKIDKKSYKKKIKILAGRKSTTSIDPNHSGGYGADVRIQLNTDKGKKYMCLWDKKNLDAQDFKIAAYFYKVCKDLGASGLGLGVFYADYPEPYIYNSNNPPKIKNGEFSDDLPKGLKEYEGYTITTGGVNFRRNGHHINEIHVDILNRNTNLLSYLNDDENIRLIKSHLRKLKDKKINTVKNNLKSNLRGWGEDFTSNSAESWLRSAIGVENPRGNKVDFTHNVPQKSKIDNSVELGEIYRVGIEKNIIK